MIRTRTRAAILLALLALGCGADEAEIMRYATAHASAMVTGTRPLWMRHKDSLHEIAETELPPEIRALHPKMVVADGRGISAYVYTSYANVTGVFIRHDRTFVPLIERKPDSPERVYRPLAPNVYWFEQPR